MQYVLPSANPGRCSYVLRQEEYGKKALVSSKISLKLLNLVLKIFHVSKARGPMWNNNVAELIKLVSQLIPVDFRLR